MFTRARGIIMFIIAISRTGSDTSEILSSTINGRHFCPESHLKQSDLRMAQKRPATLKFGCFQQLTNLHCCMSGYVTLMWFRCDSLASENCTAIKRRSLFHELRDKNQTLSLLMTSRGDNGWYRCTGVGRNHNTIKHFILLQVKVCHRPAGPPAVDPYMQNVTVTSLIAADVSMTCRGYFGFTLAANMTSNFIVWKKGNSSSTIASQDMSTDTHKASRVYYETSEIEGMRSILVSTLHIENLTQPDLGEYQCLLVNSRGQTTVRVNLQLPDECSGSNLGRDLTIHTEAEKKAAVASNTTLTCTAVICQATITGLDIAWVRLTNKQAYENWTEISQNSSDRIYFESSTIKKSNTFQSTLHLQYVRPPDYGRYRCVYYKAGEIVAYSESFITDDFSVVPTTNVYSSRPWIAVSASLAAVLSLLALIGALSYKHRHRIRFLHRKYSRLRRMSTEKKVYDALVLFNTTSNDDRAFVYDVIKEKLEGELGYRLYIRGRDEQFGDAIVNNIQRALQACKSILVVLSPDFAADEWNEFALQTQSAIFYCKITYIIFREVPLGLPGTDSLRSTIAVGKKVKWPCEDNATCRKNSELSQFWTRILLRMPPAPSTILNDQQV